MIQTKAYQAIALSIATSLLMAVSCTIESSKSDDDDGGEGGMSTSGGASAKSGGATGKGGAATGGTSAGIGGTKSSGVGGATTAGATSSATANAGSSQVGVTGGSAGSSATTAGGSAGATTAGGSAGSTGTQNGAAGAAGGPTCIDADSQPVSPTPCAGIAEKCADGTTASPARAACFDAWGAYKAPVALGIQQCLAGFPSSFDPCDTGSQVAIDACESATVANTCSSTTASISCTAWAATCPALDRVACQARLSAALDAIAVATCVTTSSVADCNQRILGCM